MLTVDALVQAPLAIVHSNTFIPNPRLATEALERLELETAPEPKITDHDPIPALGVLALRLTLGELIQTVWSVPANDVSAKLFTTTATVELLGGQTPLDVVHSKKLVPMPKSPTTVAGSFAPRIKPLPDKIDQNPLPTVGVLAANCTSSSVTQIVWLLPALDISA
jgi:hypothetical protein